MRFVFALAAIGCVSACSLTDALLQDTVRAKAKTVVNGLVAQQFPGVNAAPVTDCIMDNASSSEILSLGQAAVVGVTPTTSQLMTTIAGRPETLLCIATNQSGMFGL